jgi:putative Mn2+ efflux pump MntP
MLADKGDSKPMKDIVKTMSFFCVCVYVEKGGSESRSVSTALVALSTSILELLVVFSLPGCVSIMVEARVAFGCCMIVLEYCMTLRLFFFFGKKLWS